MSGQQWSALGWRLVALCPVAMVAGVVAGYLGSRGLFLGSIGLAIVLLWAPAWTSVPGDRARRRERGRGA